MSPMYLLQQYVPGFVLLPVAAQKRYLQVFHEIPFNGGGNSYLEHLCASLTSENPSTPAQLKYTFELLLQGEPSLQTFRAEVAQLSHRFLYNLQQQLPIFEQSLSNSSIIHIHELFVEACDALTEVRAKPKQIQEVLQQQITQALAPIIAINLNNFVSELDFSFAPEQRVQLAELNFFWSKKLVRHTSLMYSIGRNINWQGWFDQYKKALVNKIFELTQVEMNIHVQEHDQHLGFTLIDKAKQGASSCMRYVAGSRPVIALGHLLDSFAGVQMLGMQTENDNAMFAALLKASRSSSTIVAAHKITVAFVGIFKPVLGELRDAAENEHNPIVRAIRLLVPVFIVLGTFAAASVLITALSLDALIAVPIALGSIIVGGLLANAYAAVKNVVSNKIHHWFGKDKVKNRLESQFGDKADEVKQFYLNAIKDVSAVKDSLLQQRNQGVNLSEGQIKALAYVTELKATFKETWRDMSGQNALQAIPTNKMREVFKQSLKLRYDFDKKVLSAYFQNEDSAKQEIRTAIADNAHLLKQKLTVKRTEKQSTCVIGYQAKKKEQHGVIHDIRERHCKLRALDRALDNQPVRHVDRRLVV